MDDQQFRQVLDFFGLSWKGYRKVRKGVKKRLTRYMQAQGLKGLGPFLLALERDREQRAQVEKLLIVSISRFFRDRMVWLTIEKHLLPEIVARESQKVRVWSAGCARGEEAYSFKILWQEWGRFRDPLPELELWATDMNPEILDRARGGVYSLSSLKELGEEWRSRYFSPVKGNLWAISESLKERIRWKVHNLLIGDPPAKEFKIIFLRNNLLTYYQDETKKSALAKIIEALSSHGFLLIGSHERMPKSFSGFEPTLHHPAIYQKLGN